MLQCLPDNIIYTISKYMGYCETFISLKYINKYFRYTLNNNICIQRRKFQVYLIILKQQIYHKKKQHNYTFSSNTTFKQYCNKILYYIDYNKLSYEQRCSFIDIKKTFIELTL